jgi:hypothetical protein
MKPKPLTEAQFLDLLEKVLAKVVDRDLKLRAAIQQEVARELRLQHHVASLTKFCEEGAVPDLAPATVAELQEQLAATFGSEASVSVKPDEAGKGLMEVEITLPDRTFSNKVKVDPAAATPGGEGEAKVPFVPFPVALPQDAELVWVLARREDLGPDEAARALAHIEEEFWASKAGQKRQREGAERTFAEFIATVPSAALLESGLKRHYKAPEALHSLRLLGNAAPAAGSEARANPLDALFDDKPTAESVRPPNGSGAGRERDGQKPVVRAEIPATEVVADGARSEDDAPWD